MTGGTVVVLGACGRNVGAGMSGGELFVLGDVRVNGQLVASAAITPAEAVELHALLERHVRWLTADSFDAKVLARETPIWAELIRQSGAKVE